MTPEMQQLVDRITSGESVVAIRGESVFEEHNYCLHDIGFCHEDKDKEFWQRIVDIAVGIATYGFGTPEQENHVEVCKIVWGMLDAGKLRRDDLDPGNLVIARN